MNKYIFTSESVSDGHPDKVADQISDALVDAGLYAGDQTTRVAIETLVTTNHVTIAGEVKNYNVGFLKRAEIVRDVIKQIGYEQEGFHHKNVIISDMIHEQSDDIALGTDDFGAGDQGIMFGYACNHTKSMMPAPIHYSHAVLKNLKTKRGDILGPDAKSQISVEYDGARRDGAIKRIAQIVISTQHREGNVEEARNLCRLAAMEELGDLVDDKTKWHLNPTGNFVIDCNVYFLLGQNNNTAPSTYVGSIYQYKLSSDCGCTDSIAENYSPSAIIDDGSWAALHMKDAISTFPPA